MLKRLLLTAAVAIASLFATQAAFAQSTGCNGQYGQYGGCPPTQSIIINKLVSTPVASGTSSTFVDNLGPSDALFQAGWQVDFKLKVTNTSGTTLSNVTVKDTVPAYLDPVSGPGTFDNGTRTITFSAGDFAIGQEKDYDLIMQVVGQSALPNQSVTCITNQAQAFNGTVSDTDTAQMCIGKQVANVVPGPVTQVPATGPEFGWLILAANFGLMGAGFYLKKRS